MPNGTVGQKRIIALVGDAPLQPVCQTTVRRTAGHVSMADGTRAELAVEPREERFAGRVEALAHALPGVLSDRRVGPLVFGASRDKDVPAMLAALAAMRDRSMTW